jgi:hypothetical protein
MPNAAPSPTHKEKELITSPILPDFSSAQMATAAGRYFFPYEISVHVSQSMYNQYEQSKVYSGFQMAF